MVTTEIAEETRISKRESQVAEEEKQKREDEERQELLLKLQQFSTEQLKELAGGSKDAVPATVYFRESLMQRNQKIME